MPYASDKQRRFFHTETALKKGIKPSVVKEFDAASKVPDVKMAKMYKQKNTPVDPSKNFAKLNNLIKAKKPKLPEGY